MEYHSGGSLPLLGRPRYCPGAKANGGYLCETGHCCGETGCCTYYYELWCKLVLLQFSMLVSCLNPQLISLLQLLTSNEQTHRSVSLLLRCCFIQSIVATVKVKSAYVHALPAGYTGFLYVQLGFTLHIADLRQVSTHKPVFCQGQGHCSLMLSPLKHKFRSKPLTMTFDQEREHNVS